MTDDTGDGETDTEQSDDDLDPVVLSNGATDEDVEFGVVYHAVVNNVVEYGVFVTLTSGYSTEVSGLVHKTNLPPLSAPNDFTEGDTFAVQLREQTEAGLSFEVVEVMEGAKGTSEVQGAPVRDYSPTEDEDADEQASSTAPAPSQAELDAIAARLDAIESHLALDAPTIRARVVDAGGGETLLRVLDGESELDADHGEAVRVRLHDTGGQETEEAR